MKSEPIEEVYFNWLYSKVAFVMNPTPSLRFYSLLKELHSTEFVWIISGDDNRAQDGLDIRAEFLREYFLPVDSIWLGLGCSILEMLIAFSRRAEFETDLSASEWFWIFLENLELSTLNDTKSQIPQKVAQIMENFVWRTYKRNGFGGMFPLKNPREDQRKVEIWYQFYAYLDENDIV